MNKSESKELSANKRVSARRASTESDLPAADHTGTIAKRVHARRANAEPEPGQAVEPDASTLHDRHDRTEPPAADDGGAQGAMTHEGIALSAEPLTGEGIDFGAACADGEGLSEAIADRMRTGELVAAERAASTAPSTPSSVPPARARARRPRATPTSKTTTPSEAQPPTAAEPAHAAPPSAAPREAINHTRLPAGASAHAPHAAVVAQGTSAAPQDVVAASGGFAPRAAAQAGASSRERGHREAPPDLRAHDGPAGIVEAARWAASLEPEQELPPSLEHADFADDFGLDAQYESKLRPWLDSLCERHFHVELYGAENIPAHGRALLVANHSRASVWDGIVLRSALRLHHPAGRMPRWLVDDQQFHAPFLGTIVNKLGAVRACQENAERLLLREELVAVFPEGSKAMGRPYEERYRLQRFGRGGYVKLALRTGTPVFPVAIVATEHEGAVWRNRLANASRVLSAPFAALRPGLPRIGMLGVPPISARIRIYVGASIAEISRQDASVTQDDALVHELNECVRSAVQNLVNASLHA